MRMGQCKSTLSLPCQKLLAIIWDLYFGKIEGLTVRNGEPAFTPAPRITQEIKLGPEAAPRREPTRGDFALKSQVVDLFSHIGRLADGSTVTIEVRHSLPVRLMVERSA
jgi:hypothetical protein